MRYQIQTSNDVDVNVGRSAKIRRSQCSEGPDYETLNHFYSRGLVQGHKQHLAPTKAPSQLPRLDKIEIADR
jgi:hypothetical protein